PQRLRSSHLLALRFALPARPAFHRIQLSHPRLVLSVIDENACLHQVKRWMRDAYRFRDHGEPLLHESYLATYQFLWRILGEDTVNQPTIAGSHGMPKGWIWHIVRQVPLRRPAMQCGQALRLTPRELTLQEFGKQLVIAEP